jgi:hypothetical protein
MPVPRHGRGTGRLGSGRAEAQDGVRRPPPPAAPAPPRRRAAAPPPAAGGCRVWSVLEGSIRAARRRSRTLQGGRHRRNPSCTLPQHMRREDAARPRVDAMPRLFGPQWLRTESHAGGSGAAGTSTRKRPRAQHRQASRPDHTSEPITRVPNRPPKSPDSRPTRTKRQPTRGRFIPIVIVASEGGP